jgi:hypothetical protein
MPELRKLANGDVQLGGIVDDEFVPFLTLSAGKIAQHVQRAQNLKERAAEGDALAQDQIGHAIEEDSTHSKPISKWTVAELDAYADEHGVEDYPRSGNVAEKRAAVKSHADAGEEV